MTGDTHERQVLAPREAHVLPDRNQPNVFISYSRDDLDFADQLVAALSLHNFATTIDRHGIAGGEDWKGRLAGLIRDADSIVFVLSPSSAASEICAWEVAEAARLGKRILPVLCRPLENASVPHHLSSLNYIFFYLDSRLPGSGFGTGLSRLVTALNTDLDWQREHTRLLQRAIEWDVGNRPVNRLLSGADIKEAKAWIARKPREAAEPTTLHYDFIRASEEAETRRQNEERRQLEEMATAQAERAKALTEKELAQNRAAEQTQRVARRTFAGLVTALSLACVASIAGWMAHVRALEVEKQKVNLTEANRRLSAEIKLRIAPFGNVAYSLSEQWYKLATTNASSIAFIESEESGKWLSVGTGFIIKGKELYEPWGEANLLVTAKHVLPNSQAIANSRIYFPAVGSNQEFRLGELIWTVPSRNDIDVTIVQLSGDLPLGVLPVYKVSSVDISHWGIVKFVARYNAIERSTLDNPLPLIILGGSINNYSFNEPLDINNAHLVLTLSLANALGRTPGVFQTDRIVFTDSTTDGASGSPVFDANDGRLIAIVQVGSGRSRDTAGGLSYSGGIAINALKRAIKRTSEDPVAFARLLLEAGEDKGAQKLFDLALARDPAAGVRVMAARSAARNGETALAYVEQGAKLLKDGRDSDAKAQFEKARDLDMFSSTRADILNHIAWYWLEAGKAAEGLADADSALSLARGIDILDTHGEILFALGRTDEALKDLDEAISRGLNFAGALYIRGRCYEIMGKTDEAIADYRQAARNAAADQEGNLVLAQAQERIKALELLPAKNASSK